MMVQGHNPEVTLRGDRQRGLVVLRQEQETVN